VEFRLTVECHEVSLLPFLECPPALVSSFWPLVLLSLHVPFPSLQLDFSQTDSLFNTARQSPPPPAILSHAPASSHLVLYDRIAQVVFFCELDLRTNGPACGKHTQHPLRAIIEFSPRFTFSFTHVSILCVKAPAVS